jgi:hypothetical protein
MSRAMILRKGKLIGVLNCATGELTSPDAALAELWAHWQTEGFKVLGPPPEAPAPGVLADAVYTIKPGPTNLGLVAIELENHGYRLAFAETRPASTSTPNGSNLRMASPQRFYSRPANRSFEAYKEFLGYLTTSLGGESDMSEDELREAWRDFWQRADAAASGEVANE